MTRASGLHRRTMVFASDGAATDADAYTRAKTELIQEMVDAPRAARGLPKIPVWEE